MERHVCELQARKWYERATRKALKYTGATKHNILFCIMQENWTINPKIKPKKL